MLKAQMKTLVTASCLIAAFVLLERPPEHLVRRPVKVCNLLPVGSQTTESASCPDVVLPPFISQVDTTKEIFCLIAVAIAGSAAILLVDTRGQMPKARH